MFLQQTVVNAGQGRGRSVVLKSSGNYVQKVKSQDVIISAGWKTAFLFYIMNIITNALNSFYLIFSKIHKMVEVGRDLWR